MLHMHVLSSKVSLPVTLCPVRVGSNGAIFGKKNSQQERPSWDNKKSNETDKKIQATVINLNQIPFLCKKKKKKIASIFRKKTK